MQNLFVCLNTYITTYFIAFIILGKYADKGNIYHYSTSDFEAFLYVKRKRMRHEKTTLDP